MISFDPPIVAGTTLVRDAIQSQNYAAGSDGWIIESNGNAEFNDLTIRGTFLGTSFILNSNGLYFYYPSPDVGNLIGSWTNGDGVDPYGNTVFGGVTNYAGGEFVQMAIGNLFLGTFGPLSPGVTAVAPGAVSILGDNSAIVLQSPSITPTAPNNSFVTLAAGKTSVGTGNVGYPHVENTGDTWQQLPGHLIASFIPAGTGTSQPETWHSPTMGTSWATGTGIGGSWPNLTFRRDPMDNMHITGTFHVTAISPAPGPVIANGFFPVNGSTVSTVGAATKLLSGTGATPLSFPLYINNAGELRSQGTPTFAVNDTYMVNAIVPLRNIP